MANATQVVATLDDLYRIKEKAELIAGRIVYLMPTGRRPSRIAFKIARSLDDHAEATGIGEAFADNTGFAVPELTSGRQSFAPDAAFSIKPNSPNAMRFIQGPPTFAVEVRSENDYGEAAEIRLAAKRADYFEAGSLVVWDVDPINERVRKFRADAQAEPMVFVKGQTAEAEPAVPGWRMRVEAIFG